jgi:predicted peptidase
VKIIFSILVIMMLVTACERHDEVLPPLEEKPAVITQTPGTSSSVPVDSTNSASTDSVSTDSVLSTIDSAIYRAAKFKDLPYRILFPKNYDPTKFYPLLLFLHGIGESGKDNSQQLKWGAALFQADSIRTKYPAFIVFPQCPTSHRWYDDWGIETLTSFLDTLQSNYRIDKKRIYIGGLSMGAFGTYAMVAQNPDLFTAAVAISGGGDDTKASIMAKARWRIFAGRKDNIVPDTKSVTMASALKNAGASVYFTLYPQADHEHSWIQAFAEPDFCSWLFSTDDRSTHH